MTSEAAGDIVKDGKILLVRSIHVSYTLKFEGDDELRDKAERAHNIHARFCPVARTIWDCVEITTSMKIVEE